MKKILLLPLLIACLQLTVALSAPNPPTGTVGFCPVVTEFPCIERGVQFDAVMYFKNFVTIDNIIVNSFRFDSITGLPAGITAAIFPDNMFGPGEAGCIEFTGITNDPVGNDTMYMYVTINFQGLGDVDGILGEEINGPFPPDTGAASVFSVKYLRIIHPGGFCQTTTCPNIPCITSISTFTQMSANLFPNPTTGAFTLVLSRNITDYDVQILDISGRLIQTVTHLSGNKNLLDASALENGIYFYRVVSDGVAISKGKLVVMR